MRLVADWSGKPYLFRKIILTLFLPNLPFEGAFLATRKTGGKLVVRTSELTYGEAHTPKLAPSYPFGSGMRDDALMGYRITKNVAI